MSLKEESKPRRILAVSPVSSYGGFNTSAHRISALRELGFEVEVIDSARLIPKSSVGGFLRRSGSFLYRKGIPAPLLGSGRLRREFANEARSGDWDILWLEKSLDVGPSDIGIFRLCNPRARVIGFSPDDMLGRHNQSRKFISALPEYDEFLTTKTFNVPELAQLGCRRVKFIGNGYDPEAFQPTPVTAKEIAAYGGEIGFIGSYESDRALHLLELARVGLPVRVWGPQWQRCEFDHPELMLERVPLIFEKFRKACSAFKINLNFLRKLNRDQQTTRSVEIPACGGFMLAERTDEHLGLFDEGKEAEFFSSIDELIDKCRFYLANDSLRKKIAKAGYARCIRSGYSNAQRLKSALESD